MRVVVEEAHKQGLRVAAHATTPEGIKNAVTAGVDSIEHGHRADREALEMIKAKGVFLVPTVGVIDERLQQRKTGQLTPEQQRAFVESDGAAFVPVKGAWGAKGSTNVRLSAAKEALLQEAMAQMPRSLSQSF